MRYKPQTLRIVWSGPALLMTGVIACSFLQPAFGQGNSEVCFTIYAKTTEAGRTVLAVPLKVLGTIDGGRTLIEVDPKCLSELANSIGTKGILHGNEYQRANEVVDDMATRLKGDGAPETVVKKFQDDMKKSVNDAKDLGVDPRGQMNARNDANLAKAKEDGGGDKNAALVAAAGAVAGLCMVATYGVCAAAVVSLLPSLLPPDIRSEDVQGVARALNDINQGKAPTPDDAKMVLRILRDRAKVSKEAVDAANSVLENGVLPALKGQLAKTTKLQQATIDGIQKAIGTAIDTGKFDCQGFVKGQQLEGGVPTTDSKIVDKLMKIVANSGNAGTVVDPIRACLQTVFIPQ